MAFTPSTINTLRTSNSLNTTDEYYVTDPGMEGFWRFTGVSGYPWMDCLGTYLLNVPSSCLVRRIYYGHVNVKWFGALGDGINDDTDPIKKAIDYMQLDVHPEIKGNGTLYFPTGMYKVRELVIDYSNENGLIFGKITLTGDGMHYSVISGIPEYTLSDHCDEIDPDFTVTPKTIITVRSPFVSFKDLGIQGVVYEANQCFQNGEGKAGVISFTENIYEYTGIFAEVGGGNASNQLILENILLRTCEVGLWLNGSLATKINNCLLGGINDGSELTNTCNYGIKMNWVEIFPNTTSPNIVTINDTTISWCKKWGLSFQGASNLTLRGCEFFQNGRLTQEEIGDTNTGAILILDALNIYTYNTSIINISETWFQSNLGYSFYCNQNQNLIFNFFGCNFFGSTFPNANNHFFGLYINLVPTEGDERKIVNVIGCYSGTQLNSISTETFRLICSNINLMGSVIEHSYYAASANVLGTTETNILG